MSRRAHGTAKAATNGRATNVREPAAAGVDLRVRIGPLRLANPILVASGTFGYGDEYAHVLDVSALGGVITKTVTLEPCAGNPAARIAETPAGMLNSIGLENVGVDGFAEKKLPFLRTIGTHVVVNFFGETVDEYVACGGARRWPWPRSC